MRSEALRIFDIATFSIARVIFCVFFTLLILVRISLAPGTGVLGYPLRSPTA
ncbi:hypothetical protein D3C83_193210 [compost metagenome]